MRGTAPRPWQGRAHFGGPSSSPTSPPRSGAVPLRVGSPLLRLQRRDLHVERLDPRPRLGRFRRVPRVRRSGLPGRSRRLLVGATYRSGFSSGAPDDRCGGFSRRRSAAAASPASRARASCVAWFSDVTPSATPARSNAQFISAAHACRVSSSYARGFVRSLSSRPRTPGPRSLAPRDGTTARPSAPPRRSPAQRIPGGGAGCPPPPPSSSGRREPPACTATHPPSRTPRSSAPDPADPRSPASRAAPPLGRADPASRRRPSLAAGVVDEWVATRRCDGAQRRRAEPSGEAAIGLDPIPAPTQSTTLPRRRRAPGRGTSAHVISAPHGLLNWRGDPGLTLAGRAGAAPEW